MVVSTPEERDLARRLRAQGGRVTPQRLVIARALRERPRHVTAEALLDEVGDRLPGLSLPTVYATLELLERLGEVRRVAVPGGPVAWDSRLDPHQHAVCRECGEVADLDAPVAGEPALAAARGAGFVPERAEVVVTGLCARCAGGYQS